jgi:pimeloyl-ACP methyl ester carboxylesterase
VTAPPVGQASAPAPAAPAPARPLPTPTDPPGTFIGDVHVVDEGPRGAPAVALIHGIPGSVRDFRYLGPALAARGVRSIRIDLPGFGKTPARAFNATSLPDRAVFIERVMHALDLDTFALAAHSFGGGIATHCAALFPERVTALVCINSLSPRRHKGYFAPGAVIRTLGRLVTAPVVGPPLHAQLAAGYGRIGLKSENGLAPETVQLQFSIFGSVSFKDYRVAASLVKAPTLLVSSKDDPLVEPACTFAFARALRQAPLVSHIHVDSGGHFLQKFQAPAIAEWLARTLTRDAEPTGA